MSKSHTHQLLAAVWLLVLFLDVGLVLTILILGQSEKVKDTLNGLCAMGCGCVVMSTWNAVAALWAWATTRAGGPKDA